MNRTELSGYKVVFTHFEDVEPNLPDDFLTGFVPYGEENKVFGRLVCVTVIHDGSLLVNNDDSGIIWKVTAI